MSDLEHAQTLIEMARGELNSFAVRYRYGPLDAGDDDLDPPGLLRDIEAPFVRLEGKMSSAL